MGNFLWLQRVFQGGHENPNGQNTMSARNFHNVSISQREEFRSVWLEKSFRLNLCCAWCSTGLASEVHPVGVRKLRLNRYSIREVQNYGLFFTLMAHEEKSIRLK